VPEPGSQVADEASATAKGTLGLVEAVAAVTTSTAGRSEADTVTKRNSATSSIVEMSLLSMV
jgi:hypothetical protein